MPNSPNNLLELFVQQVGVRGSVCTVYDELGTPGLMTERGGVAEPYWSNTLCIDSRFTDFWTKEIPWKEFRDEVLPRLERNNILVAINCAYPLDERQLTRPEDLREALDRTITKAASDKQENLMRFAREVAVHRMLYTICDKSEHQQALRYFREQLVFKHIAVIDNAGPPELYTQSGKLVVPYWSNPSLIGPEFAGFSSFAVPWEAFRGEDLRRLEANNLFVGINCTNCLSRPVEDSLCVIPFNVMVAVELQMQFPGMGGDDKE